MQQYKIDQIRSQERRDWSKQFVEGATIDCLDPAAIKLAREKYKEKMRRDHITAEVDEMTDEQFLEKRKLVIGGKVTNAAMLLLGNSDYDRLFKSASTMMWRLYGNDGELKDYTILRIPFINATDQIYARIRNLTYRYMPDQLSLFPREIQQYDSWLLRELLNNCIAHSNYQLGGRVYINEFEDHIKITNPGDFLPQTIENVLQISYNPPFYRNQLLAEASEPVFATRTGGSEIHERVAQLFIGVHNNRTNSICQTLSVNFEIHECQSLLLAVPAFSMNNNYIHKN